MDCLHQLLIISFLLLNIYHLSYGAHRNISFQLNPDCLDANSWTECEQTLDCSDPWLVHGKGLTSNSTVHYLWGFEELPTFIMMSTVKDSEILIDWCLLQDHRQEAITLKDTLPQNVFGISFQNLILFNDRKNTGVLDNIPAEDRLNISLTDFDWSLVNTSTNLKFTFETTTFQTEALNNTKISFTITSFEDNDRMDELPHLLTTSSSSQIDILLDNLTLTFNNKTLNGFESPRWAMDMILVSYEEVEDKGFLYSSHKSLDDEYTPGIFDLISITTASARMSNSTSVNGGYLQWRPVCYLDKDDNINYSTYPNIKLDKDNYLAVIDEGHRGNNTKSLLYSLFGGDYSKNSVNQGQTVISFGLTDDGFYTKYKYTKWTMSIGLGAVPEESFSSLVIIVICVGVGVPLIIFLISGIYFGVKKIKRSKEEDRTSLIRTDE